MDLDKLKAEDSGICVMLWVKELSTCEQRQDRLVAMMDTGKSAMQPLLLPAYREMIKHELIAGHVNTSSVWLSDPKAALSARGEQLDRSSTIVCLYSPSLMEAW